MRADQPAPSEIAPEPDTAPGALSGIVVADFGRVLAGPYMTMLLADLGADVIKIERPGTGDDTRAWGPPFAGGEATYFLGVNRNKRSVSLDLTDPGDLAAARAIVDRADVLVENFRPGTMEKLGLGHEDVRATNPGLVYCSVTGFGTAEGARLPGYDLLVQAMGGLMSVTGEPDGPGTKTGVALVDVVTGLHAGMGVLAALRHRERTGEASAWRSRCSAPCSPRSPTRPPRTWGRGSCRARWGTGTRASPRTRCSRAEDRPLVLAVGNDRQFRALCERLGLPETAGDGRFATNAARVAHREELAAALAGPLGSRTADAWCEELTAAGVPCGPVNDLAAAFDLADRLGLAPRVPESAAGPGQVAHPIRFGATPPSYRAAPRAWASTRTPCSARRDGPRARPDPGKIRKIRGKMVTAGEPSADGALPGAAARGTEGHRG